LRRLAVLALSVLSACAPMQQDVPPSRAQSLDETLPPMRSFTQAAVDQPARPNAEILQDFLDLTFRMESGRAIPEMTRFEGPISVRVSGDIPATLVPDLRLLLDRLRTEAGIDIFLTGAPEASITIEGISRADLQATAPRAACFVVPRISSWEDFREVRRTPQVDWTTLTRRDKAAIFIPTDTAPQEIRDCLHEELAQALGPLNDLYRLPDSVFNDDNIHTVLTGFDMLLLRAYYAPELANGMRRGEAAARLPALLARLNPGGEFTASSPLNDTSRDWIDAIELALSGQASPARRRAAAEQAINLTRAFGWTGPRRGFAFYVFGRLEVGHNPDLAFGAFTQAYETYLASPQTQLHAATVAVQLAAYSLSAGDARKTVELADFGIPIAMAHENAALLATLMMFKAEALAMQGRGPEAAALRLDSLGWARYGFGSDRNVRARMREIAALNPLN
jgi:hypothetical protein